MTKIRFDTEMERGAFLAGQLLDKNPPAIALEFLEVAYFEKAYSKREFKAAHNFIKERVHD